MPHDTVILGGGITGLAAGLASGCPVFEARGIAGGICGSYYLEPGATQRLAAPAGRNVYRFEYGGGHWIFGGEPWVLRRIHALASLRRYQRRSAVYFPDRHLSVPYPLQHHLDVLGADMARQAGAEMAQPRRGPSQTMAQWLQQQFGPTLCRLFFAPFHERYTAGFWTVIAPQDAYKSPSRQGAAAGYNATFAYPVEGLNALIGGMAGRCDVHYGKPVTRIDPRARLVHFADGDAVGYQRLISTLPLNRMCELTGLAPDAPADPHTSVLVLNLGAVRGPRCPDDHWIYVPSSRAGFHRVGFYSNVDAGFLPADAGTRGRRVSLYVERAYPGGQRPSEAEMVAVRDAVVEELRAWGFITEIDVVDPTWVDVAYTWAYPGSLWRSQALEALAQYHIHQVGRYGRWMFQGIADSLRDGLAAGAAVGQRAAAAVR